MSLTELNTQLPTSEKSKWEVNVDLGHTMVNMQIGSETHTMTAREAVRLATSLTAAANYARVKSRERSNE